MFVWIVLVWYDYGLCFGQCFQFGFGFDGEFYCGLQLVWFGGVDMQVEGLCVGVVVFLVEYQVGY